MASLAFLSNQLVSLCFTWPHRLSFGSHLGSLGIAWPHLESLNPPGVTGFHFLSLGLTWLHLASLGLTWFCSVSHRSHLELPGLTRLTWITWTHLDLPGPTGLARSHKGKVKISHSRREKGQGSTSILGPDLTRQSVCARATTETKRCSA